MKLIDADKFLSYLIFSKHIDGLTCGEVKEAIEMCKVDVVSEIRAEFINKYPKNYMGELELGGTSCVFSLIRVLDIIDKYKAESEG